MDGDHDTSGVGDRRLECVRIHVVRRGVHVDENGSRAGRLDRRNGRDEGVGLGDDLVARPEVQSSEDQFEGREPRVHTNGVVHGHVSGEGCLEPGHRFSQDEITSLQHPCSRCIDFGLVSGVFGLQVDERNVVAETGPCFSSR